VSVAEWLGIRDPVWMNSLNDHYLELLGLDEAWRVMDVELDLDRQRVRIRLGDNPDACVCCPECGEQRPRHDHAPERSWRHLDTMQFETLLTAAIPRAKCPQCGIKTCRVPWAEPHGEFTLMFEAFAIRVLQAASSVEQARLLLDISWSCAQGIMDRAVARGLIERSLDEVTHVGLDEKSFRRGQDYVSVMTDIDGSRVLDVSQGRDEAAADKLWDTLSQEQKDNVQAVAMDMWQAYENSTVKQVPEAEIVHDRFHIAKYLNEAVDKVRRQEHKALKGDGDKTLTGTRQLWLYNPGNMSDEQWRELQALRKQDLRTSRAWALREHFRWFWEYRYAGNAKKFFASWYQWASRCRLPPMRKVAKMIKHRLPNILTWFRHRISNGPAEGFNSRIQSIKSAARGFRNFENYRTRILFFCGKLKLLPETSHYTL
jgi:transposase